MRFHPPGNLLNQKGLAPLILIIILVLASIGLTGGLLLKQNNSPGPASSPYPSADVSAGCTHDTDCFSGLVCHSNRCAQPLAGACSGSADTSCPSGYKCTQKCGPPIVRADDEPPGYQCLINELAEKPRNCPICLASNTMIATPQGEIQVTDLKTGMAVWSVSGTGEKVASRIIKVSRTPVPKTHQVVHLALADGRQLWVSPNHPAVNGKKAGELKSGEKYDGAVVAKAELVPYWDDYTYDLLPDSASGYYFANGILMASTLK